MDILTLSRIYITLIALFILPFLPFTLRVFKDTDFTLKILVSAIIGLFTSLAIVYSLSILGIFTNISFLISYIIVISLANGYILLRTNWRRSKISLHLKPYVFLLLISLCVGFYLRVYDSLIDVSLPQVDAYTHLLFAKMAAQSATYPGIIDTYPRGFQIILALTSFYSGVDVYSILRFSGAFFGVLSIIAVYCLGSFFDNRFVGLFAVLIYSCFSLYPGLILQSAADTPSIFGFIFLPIISLFFYGIIRDLKQKNIIAKNVVLYSTSIILITLIDPYYTLIITYAIFILIFVGLILYKELRDKKSIALISLLASIGVLFFLFYERIVGIFFAINLPTLVSQQQFWTQQTTSFGTILDMLTPKETILTFPITIALCFLFIMLVGIALYGIVKRNLGYAFIGFSTALFCFSYITGVLENSSFRGRSGIYFLYLMCQIGGLFVYLYSNQIWTGLSKKILSVPQSVINILYYLSPIVLLAGYFCFIAFNNYLVRSSEETLLVASIVIILGLIVILIQKYRFKVASKQLFKTLVVVALLAILLSSLTPPIIYRIGYEENIEVALEITKEFQLKYVTVFSFSTNFSSASYIVSFEEAIVKPDGNYEPLNTLWNYNPSASFNRSDYAQTYIFIFIEKKVFPLDISKIWGTESQNEVIAASYASKAGIMQKAMDWITIYNQTHTNLTTYFEDENLAVYLINNSDALS